MKLRSCRLPGAIWCTLIAGVLSGCHHTQKRECVVERDRSAAVPIAPGAPRVTVIGNSAPREQIAALKTLVDEIHNGLASAGGLRMMASSPIDGRTVCSGGQQCAAALNPDEPEMLYAEFDTTRAELHIPEEVFPPSSRLGHSGEPIEVRISIAEFIPYRPMRLTATIAIHNLATGQEVSAIQGTWHGNEECEPLADANCSLQRSLKRPECRIAAETQNLITLSPQLFLQQVAAEVVPAIHTACCSSGCVIIEEVL